MSFNNKVPLEFTGLFSKQAALATQSTPEFSLFYRLDEKKVYYLVYSGSTATWVEVGASPS